MMETKLLKPDSEGISSAKDLILSGAVVAVPTETVYGLAANAYDPDAVSRIFEAKGRPQDNPLIVHIADLAMLYEVAREVSPTAEKLAREFWGGPLTMVLPRSECIPDAVTGGLDSVGVRMPADETACALIRACGVPLAAPSANVSGKPSPTTAGHVLRDLDGRIPAVLDGGASAVGVESTVVRVGRDSVEILRPGAVTVDDFLRVVSHVTIDDGVFSSIDRDAPVASPGMKYRHYSPKAEVILVEGSFASFLFHVKQHAGTGDGVLVFEGEALFFSCPCFTYGKQSDSASQANRLFDALRRIDASQGLSRVFARMPDRDGVGLAVYNRLLRACGFRVEEGAQLTVIGLTGQSGAGKSLAASRFAESGLFGVVDCDRTAHQVLTFPEVITPLCGRFGRGILAADGQIDRKALGQIVFADGEALEFLNKTVFPHILGAIAGQMEKLYRQGYRMILLDAPTLFESGADILCDSVISVLAPAAVRKERIMQRDGLPEQDAKRRMDAQHDDCFYRERSEFSMTNDGSVPDFIGKIEQQIEQLKERHHGGSQT